MLLTGCWPIPHTTPKSPDVRGRVLDARARTPIEGAEVFLYDHPSTSTKTDSQGFFHLKATRNFHLAYKTPEGEWPQGTYFDVVVVFHTNYLRCQFYSLDLKDDILLESKK